MSSDLPIGRLPPDQIVPALPKGVWFSAVGEPLRANDYEECERYLRGLQLPPMRIERVDDWTRAQEAATSTHWRREWWEKERAEERRLFDTAATRYSADAVLMRLTNLMEGSADLFIGPASVACARSGVTDTGLARSAAGAASHSLHQYGLATMSGENDDHAFATRFRLFLAGRWPLSVIEETFLIF